MQRVTGCMESDALGNGLGALWPALDDDATRTALRDALAGRRTELGHRPTRHGGNAWVTVTPLRDGAERVSAAVVSATKLPTEPIARVAE
jgi:hypothetical protein